MTRAVILYCAHGHVETMPEAVAEGARAAGAEVDIRRVTVPVPDKIARRSSIRPNKASPISTTSELAQYVALVVGTGTRFGRISSKMNNSLNQAASLWARDALVRMVGAAFTSTASQQGGQETTLPSILTNLLHFCMTIVGLNYGVKSQLEIVEERGGSPYGRTTIAGADGSRKVHEEEQAAARHPGKRVAETAAKLAETSKLGESRA